jgi:NADPH2:quinone reductase
MRVVRYDRFGGIDQLYVDEVPDPEPGPGDALVRVRATAINPGSLSALNGAAYVPIRDLAGDVVAVSDEAKDCAVGDGVLGWLQDWAAHAQLVVVPAGQLVLKRDALSWDVAGSLYVTPMAGLAGVKAVQPQAGEVVVVSGASGGVGFTAAQLARRTGATVIGLAGLENGAWLAERGIIPVAYGDGQEERVRAASDGRKIDAFIDAVGGGYVDLALALGVPPTRINTAVDYQAAQTTGVRALGTRDAGGAPALCELADLAASGELSVPIGATYPLDRVQEAYRAVAERRTRGRVVLHPQE